MRAAVVVFPGSNCDHDVLYALRNILGIQTEAVFHRDPLPQGLDLVVLPGGFSFGDYLRCGAIARVSPIMSDVRAHAARGGFVLGICNGFQVLTEAGMLPGALTRNAHRRFECRDVFLQTDGNHVVTAKLGSNALRVPIAHADGRYQADVDTIRRLEGEGEIAFRYCDADGAVTPAANPNGAQANIAGIFGGPRRNILGMMPHPERLAEAELGGIDGRRILEGVLCAATA